MKRVVSVSYDAVYTSNLIEIIKYSNKSLIK